MNKQCISSVKGECKFPLRNFESIKLSLQGYIVRMAAVTFAVFSLSSAVFADGFIVMPNPNPSIRTPYPLEVRYHNVDVKIDGLSAKTTIDQEFVNPTAYRLEGYYIFPVPKNAVINTFSMEIDGKETEAELLDADKARTIYEDIVRKQLDPAIMEYSERSIYKVRIFPIEPRSTKKIRIAYTEVLTLDSGSVEYVYPLNTEKFSSKNLESVRINVEIAADNNVGNIFCPTHEIKVLKKQGKTATVLYEDKNVKPDTDFKLYYDYGSSNVGVVFRSYRKTDTDGFFFLNAAPVSESVSSEIQPKDIVFALDVSGSMAGEKLDQAKKALLFCINNLNKGDRFQIIRFSTEAEALFPSVTAADSASIQKARQFIDSLKAIGGTNIEEALKLSMDSIIPGPRPEMVVFITDGKPTIGETEEDTIINELKKINKGGTRVFTFGVGFDINTHLLDKITDATRAFRSYVTPTEDIEIKVSQFYTKIQSPALTDIAVTFSGVKGSKIYPKVLPDLFVGSSLTLLGRYSGSGNSVVTITGKVNGKQQLYTYKVTFPEENSTNDYIPQLWASRRVGFLLDQIRLSGESKEVVDEIVSLAREYGIITPYTSYLILEDETRRVDRREVSEADTTIRNIMPAPNVAQEAKKEFYALKSETGAGSVNASSAVQGLYDSDNVSRTKKDAERSLGSTAEFQNAYSKVKQFQGQAFYNSGNYWIDPKIQGNKSAVQRIKFGSREYFEFAKNNSGSAQYLALGKKC